MVLKNKMFQGFLLTFLVYGSCWSMENPDDNGIKRAPIMIAIAVINERKELLLGKPKGHNEWIIPMDLMRNKDRTTMNSIKRYMLEQAGMSVYNLNFCCDASYTIPDRNEESIALTFFTKNFEGIPCVSSSSTADFVDWKWFAAEDLPPAVKPYNKEMFSIFVQNFMKR